MFIQLLGLDVLQLEYCENHGDKIFPRYSSKILLLFCWTIVCVTHEIVVSYLNRSKFNCFIRQ